MSFSATAALEHLRRAHDQNRLAHAYLISGPVGSGKRDVAAQLASMVNGTPVENVFSAKAREIFVAEPESKSRRIVIEQIRQLEHSLQMHGGNGRHKIAIISDADRFQPQAANAFLKTLEEPREIPCFCCSVHCRKFCPIRSFHAASRFRFRPGKRKNRPPNRPR